MTDFANSLQSSSEKIRQVISHYEFEETPNIFEFCDTIDSYVRFLNTYVELYGDSDEALKFMIEKNK